MQKNIIVGALVGLGAYGLVWLPLLVQQFNGGVVDSTAIATVTLFFNAITLFIPGLFTTSAMVINSVAMVQFLLLGIIFSLLASPARPALSYARRPR
ncbi:MAG: hypothetical protein MUD01_00655 [Chloroflexaceae bacterium]|jgi:hypothetical protein|nr:hypothetical protein [Chloroflexaceae bacterium]